MILEKGNEDGGGHKTREGGRPETAAETEPITRLKTFLLKPSAGGGTRQLVILTSCSVTSCGTIFPPPPPPRQSQTKKPLGQQQYCFGATIKSYLKKSCNAIDRLSDGMEPRLFVLWQSSRLCSITFLNRYAHWLTPPKGEHI